MPSSPDASWTVAALYRFAPVADTAAMQDRLQTTCRDQEVLGTLLIASEGVNGTIAGTADGIDHVVATIRSLGGFADLDVKYSSAATMPFHRLKVRIKPEIVTMGRPDLDPIRDAGTYVAAAAWNALIADPGTVVIDTRNAYEVAVGTFAGAVDPQTVAFRDFPDWFRDHGRILLDQKRASGIEPKVAMFCTGGIRCEKATALLKSEGVDQVHHLEGGILRYLETVPEDESLWQGECFVFDERVAVGHGLTPGSHSLCRGCRMPVSAEGRQSPYYVEGVCCERCHESRTEDQRRGYAERHRQVGIAEQRGETHVGAASSPVPAR